MTFEMPASLECAVLKLRPVSASDFEALYAVAADPLIWEQHPNPDRYRRDVFANYFQGALESGGAWLVFDAKANQLIGCSRYYEFDPVARSIAIGYTFIARSHWGGGYNRPLKKLMLDHAFRFVEKVIFHVGESNLRSRIAMERLGAALVGVVEVAYYGEASKPNAIYEITRQYWTQSRLT